MIWPKQKKEIRIELLPAVFLLLFSLKLLHLTDCSWEMVFFPLCLGILVNLVSKLFEKK